MNNEIDNNQHYITESFIKKRFGVNGFVNRYDVKYGGWKTNASPQFIFSSDGYTQFLEAGQPVDNSLEKSFNNLENELRVILPILDDATTRTATPVDEGIFNNLCFYCAYLWYLSPFAKAKAPANFVMQVDLCLKHGNTNFLRAINLSDERIKTMQQQYADGYRFILQGENYLQYAFRGEFVRNCRDKAAMFRYLTKWTVYNSPIELPIADIALVDYPESKNVTLFMLPISPQRVLIGRLVGGTPPPPPMTNTILYGADLTVEAAEDVLDVISLSALKAIVCQNKMDIAAIRDRAKKKKISFTKINNLDDVLSAGRKVFDRSKSFDLVAVTKEEYIKYVHTFIGPAGSYN